MNFVHKTKTRAPHLKKVAINTATSHMKRLIMVIFFANGNMEKRERNYLIKMIIVDHFCGLHRKRLIAPE